MTGYLSFILLEFESIIAVYYVPSNRLYIYYRERSTGAVYLLLINPNTSAFVDVPGRF